MGSTAATAGRPKTRAMGGKAKPALNSRSGKRPEEGSSPAAGDVQVLAEVYGTGTVGWEPLLTSEDIRTPYAREYAPGEEPSLPDLVLDDKPGRRTWPIPRFPEHRFAELESMLELETPSVAFRSQLHEILSTTVSCDPRINPHQEAAHAWYRSREKARLKRLKDIADAAHELHQLLVSGDDDRERRNLAWNLDGVFPYPREGATHPLWELTETLETMAKCADRAANRGRRGVGRKVDYFAAWLVRHLADLYHHATGRRPARSSTWDGGRPGGPFFRFVRDIYDWLGSPYREKTDEAVAGDIRRYKPSGTVRR